MTQRILITGATGALGQVLAAFLRNQPAKFVVLTAGRSEADCHLDLHEIDSVSKAIHLAAPDTIFHLAATFTDKFDDAYRVNVLGAKALLEAVQSVPKPIRVVLIGSASEYGAVEKDENPINEGRVLRPVSVYGLTKAWQTQLGLLNCSRGIDVVVARIFNLTGQSLSEKLFAGRMHQQIAEIHRGLRGTIDVGPLSAMRDYISVEDAVIQIMAIAELGRTAEVYHVGSGVPIVMRDLLARELLVNGLDWSVVRESAGFSNRRGYDVPLIYADMSKTRKLLSMSD